jgi:hypothetical protein
VLLQVGPTNLIRVAGGSSRDDARNPCAAREDGIAFIDGHFEVCGVKALSLESPAWKDPISMIRFIDSRLFQR